ncbi:MAG TPA: hypothetical protein VHB01_05140 [Nitrosospira sp.]|jgi:hypothetical protein|nr:hypothetical protein [Nitrosospira sp.]
MAEYVIYMREQDGRIERVDYAFANYPDGPVQFYVYEEQLAGFPESKVFWAAHSGPSLGIAPLVPCTESADTTGISGSSSSDVPACTEELKSASGRARG